MKQIIKVVVTKHQSDLRKNPFEEGIIMETMQSQSLAKKIEKDETSQRRLYT